MDDLGSNPGLEALVERPESQKVDLVNRPPHYNEDPSGVECIQVTRHMNFNLGNVVKYIWRAGRKDRDKLIEDLEKAAWYLNDEIQRLKRLIEPPKKTP